MSGDDQMIGRRLSHFRILSRIGEGGMGVVYEAEDEKLGRKVALKVLQPEAVGNEERRLRFLREAHTAAAVTHPHIATIHEIDEVDGVIFIAMERVEGRMLSVLIDDRPLERRMMLRIAREIAEALARAHEAGVVHRDLKPENIIVGPDGHAKVLDFGLAKLVDEPAGEAGEAASRMQTISAEMTREGRVMGTAAYMSPEQARGLAVDARSDLFSFGVVLYEMATGRVPFRGRTVTDTLSAILRDTPGPPSKDNPDVPFELERIIAKCLEKDPADRYQHADELVVDLRKLKRETDSIPLPRMTSGPVPAAAAAKPSWLRPLPVAVGAVGILALVALAVMLFRTGGLTPSAEAGVSSLAVLPLQNLKDSDDPQRLGQILQELIITDLSELDSLKVFSSQRLFDVQKQLGKGDDRTLDRDVATEVASKAGASKMLTGSLSQLGTKWILTSQLVNVADGAVIGSERIDGTDLYSMVDRLTAQIRANLRISPSGGDELSVKERTTSSLEAYQHYLTGVEHLNEQDWQEAIEALDKAVEIDPEFGQAYYKLAVAKWWLEERWVPSRTGSPTEIVERLMGSEIKLSSKERALAEAVRHLLQYDYAPALKRYERLVEDYPDEKEAWYGLGEARWHLPGGSRSLEAVAAFEKAIDLDPSFHLAYSHVRNVYTSRKMHDEAIGKLRALVSRSPDDPFWRRELLRWLARKADRDELAAAVEEALRMTADPEEKTRILQSVEGTLMGQGFRDIAEGYVVRAVETAPEGSEVKADALTSLGWFRLDDHEYAVAEEQFRDALDIRSDHPGALTGLFRVHEMERRLGEGILAVRGFVSKSPEHLPLYTHWIDLAVKKGDDREVERAVAEGLKHCRTDGDKKRVWGAAVGAFGWIGDTNRQKEFLDKIVAAGLDKGENSYFNQLGWNAMARWDLDRAEEWFRRSLETFEGEISALLGLSEVSQRRGDHAGAVESLEELVLDFPDQGWRHARLIEAHLRAGDDRRADAALDAGLEEMPSDTRRRNLLEGAGRRYLRTGRTERARELFDRAAGLDPDSTDVEVLTERAHAAMLLGRLDEAEPFLRRALEVAPRSLWNHEHMATLELLAGRHAAAESRVRDLLASGPVARSLRILLAEILAESGKFRQAGRAASQALAMHSDRKTNTTLAWVLIAGDLDIDRGIDLARRALEMPADPGAAAYTWPSTPSPEHALGLAHLKNGEHARAVELLEKAAKLRPDRRSIREHLDRARAAR